MSTDCSRTVDLDAAFELVSAILDGLESATVEFNINRQGQVIAGTLWEVARKLQELESYQDVLRELDRDGSCRWVIETASTCVRTLEAGLGRRLAAATGAEDLALVRRELAGPAAALPLPDRLALWQARDAIGRSYERARDKRLSADAEDGDNAIRQVGRVWEIRFQRERGCYPVTGNKAVGDLVKLLAAPNRQLTVAQLLGDPEGKLKTNSRLGAELETDAEGVKAIKRRLTEIEDIAEEVGWSRHLENEHATLVARLKGIRSGTHKKMINTPEKRAHSTIAVRIRAFLKKLANGMPNLAAHLTAALKLDFPKFGYYPPPGTPRWKI